MSDYEITREETKLSKEEKKYLNSKARVMKRILFSIIEYVIVVMIMIALATYLQYHSFDNFIENLKSLKDWIQPGGMLFNAIVGFLPVIAVGCIGVYFGEGTVGRMVFGIARCVAVIVWFMLIFQGASTSLDLPEVLATMEIGGVSLDSMVVGTAGLLKFLLLIMCCSMLIPIGEFLGARRKHNDAYAHKQRLKAQVD